MPHKIFLNSIKKARNLKKGIFISFSFNFSNIQFIETEILFSYETHIQMKYVALLARNLMEGIFILPRNLGGIRASNKLRKCKKLFRKNGFKIFLLHLFSLSGQLYKMRKKNTFLWGENIEKGTLNLRWFGRDINFFFVLFLPYLFKNPQALA